MFDKVDYIRVGSYTKRLSEYPAMQAQLWDKIRNSRFEERYAKQDMKLEDALRMLDYSVYFDNCGIIQPTDFAGVAHYMQQDEIVVRQDNGVVLFSEIPFSAISIEDKLWACYLHACIRQVEGEQLTNSSLRERFGLKDSSAGSISRLIKEAVSMKLIKPLG